MSVWAAACIVQVRMGQHAKPLSPAALESCLGTELQVGPVIVWAESLMLLSTREFKALPRKGLSQHAAAQCMSDAATESPVA